MAAGWRLAAYSVVSSLFSKDVSNQNYVVLDFHLLLQPTPLPSSFALVFAARCIVIFYGFSFVFASLIFHC